MHWYLSYSTDLGLKTSPARVWTLNRLNFPPHSTLRLLSLLLLCHLVKSNDDLCVLGRVWPSRCMTICRAQSCSRPLPWRPTTCQVAIATGEEGAGPMATDTYLPTRMVSVMCDLHPRLLSETQIFLSVKLTCLQDSAKRRTPLEPLLLDIMASHAQTSKDIQI